MENAVVVYKPKKRTMKLVSLWLPEPMLRAIEEIVGAGYFPSKSELIRFAIAEYIREFRRELGLCVPRAATGR